MESEASLMYVACCSCKQIIGSKPGPLNSISHTLCGPCEKKAVDEAKKSIENRKDL